MKNKRKHWGAVFVAALLLAVGLVGPAAATDDGNSQQCPSGYSKIDYSGSLAWVSTGNFDSVVLVGGPDNENNQDPDGRFKYFTDVKQGDTISRIAHEISHICTYVAPQVLTVTPAVIFTQPTCPDPSAEFGWSGTSMTGVASYSIQGTPGPLASVTVTANLASCYSLASGASASFPFTYGAGAVNCTPPPPPPGPEASANLIAGGICPIDVNLIDYLVEGENWTTGTLTILVDGAVVATYNDVAPGSFGTLDWPLDADGLPYASISLQLEAAGLVRTAGPIDLDEDCAEVGGVVIVTPTPVDTEPEPTDEEPVVKGEVVTLPETGVPALVLTLLGLLSMGAGGALLRRRP
jgi:LPXTG-motif cell wall-anchored protein